MDKKLIIAAATLIGAIAIITIFSLLANQVPPAADTNSYIEQLKRQSPGEKTAAPAGDAAPTAALYQGKLAALAADTITIIEKNTAQNRYFAINANTSISYGGKSFTLADLHVGDELDITAGALSGGALLARTIVITLSTSPTVPTQINVDPGAPGVILPPSKRNIL